MFHIIYLLLLALFLGCNSNPSLENILNSSPSTPLQVEILDRQGNVKGTIELIKEKNSVSFAPAIKLSQEETQRLVVENLIGRASGSFSGMNSQLFLLMTNSKVSPIPDDLRVMSFRSSGSGITIPGGYGGQDAIHSSSYTAYAFALNTNANARPDGTMELSLNTRESPIRIDAQANAIIPANAIALALPENEDYIYLRLKKDTSIEQSQSVIFYFESILFPGYWAMYQLVDMHGLVLPVTLALPNEVRKVKTMHFFIPDFPE